MVFANKSKSSAIKRPSLEKSFILRRNDESDPFCCKFIEHHGLSTKVMAGEEESVSDETVELEDVLPNELKRWKANDVFNCDATGLFFKMLPNRTLAKKGK